MRNKKMTKQTAYMKPRTNHYENDPIQIYRKFHLQKKNNNKKTENFQIKKSDIFYVSAQNIVCGYSLG